MGTVWDEKGKLDGVRGWRIEGAESGREGSAKVIVCMAI